MTIVIGCKVIEASLRKDDKPHIGRVLAIYGEHVWVNWGVGSPTTHNINTLERIKEF